MKENESVRVMHIQYLLNKKKKPTNKYVSTSMLVVSICMNIYQECTMLYVNEANKL